MNLIFLDMCLLSDTDYFLLLTWISDDYTSAILHLHVINFQDPAE